MDNERRLSPAPDHGAFLETRATSISPQRRLLTATACAALATAWAGVASATMGAARAAVDAEADAGGELVLGVGETYDLPAPRGQRIFVSDGRVAKAVDLGDKLRLQGRKPGAAEAVIGQTRRRLRILPLDVAECVRRLRQAARTMVGVRVDVEADGAWARGRLLRASDWKRLADAAKGAPFRFAAEVEESARGSALAFVRARLAAANLPEPALSLSPLALASLSPEQADLLPRYAAALKPLGFEIESNASTLALEPLVRVNILIAEFRKSFSSKIGLRWPASAQAQLLPAWVPPGSEAAPLAVDVDAFEQSGLGKVLAQPNVLCRSGKEASFFAGGEFPIRVSGFRQRDVIWKKYGVSLKVKPKADSAGRMSVGLEAEVSALDQSVAVDGLPAVVANRIDSHFDLKGRRTIALSGLLKKEWGDSTDGLPGLARLPVLGKLFGSQDWRERKTELVVFVTPEVTDSGAEDLGGT